eukprot:3870665-Pleurochrysis_carterae.AAC.1
MRQSRGRNASKGEKITKQEVAAVYDLQQACACGSTALAHAIPERQIADSGQVPRLVTAVKANRPRTGRSL